MEKVYIIYRKGTFNSGQKVEGIVWTLEQANEFASKLSERLDPMFGIDIQEWIMDARRPITSKDFSADQIDELIKLVSKE